MRIVVVLAVVVACAAPVRSWQPPANAVKAADYDRLLQTYVGSDGRVDYERWQANHRDVAAFDRYLAHVTNRAPTTYPADFATDADELAYWINLYNALVLREVVRRWPLDSVRDVTHSASSIVVRGRGFFRDLTFVVGGRSLSLDDIEHNIIRKRYADARTHFAVNCGSTSCPVLRRDAFDAASLETQLHTATVAFIHDPSNVRIDHRARKVRMSKLFDWYAVDFEKHAARALTRDRTSVVDFVLLYANDELAADLRRARNRGYPIAYVDYDWSVNRAKASDAGVGRVLPDMRFPLLRGGTWTPGAARGNVLLVDFWATYCKPCRQSFPLLQALADRYGERGFEVVAVSLDDSDDAVRAFLHEVGTTFAIARDPKQTSLEGALAIDALPTSLLVDRDGVVRYRIDGADPAASHELAARVEALVAE